EDHVFLARLEAWRREEGCTRHPGPVGIPLGAVPKGSSAAASGTALPSAQGLAVIDSAISQFVEDAFAEGSAAWDEDAVRSLAARVAPQALGGSADWILRGDANMLWARWFLE